MRDAIEIRTTAPAICLCGERAFEVMMQTADEPLSAIIRCQQCGDVFLARDLSSPVLLDTRWDKRL